MAWISGLADKAENILNKLDQNAASALQVTTATGGAGAVDIGESNALETMRRSLSSSKLSLKSALSPAKAITAGNSLISSGKVDTSDVMATYGTILTDSTESKPKMEWTVNSAVSSRRSSINSHADAVVAIEVEETNPKHDVLRKVATEGSFLSSSPDGQELMAFKIALSEVTSERDELRARINAMNRDNEKALLLKRLQESESLLQRLTDERDQAQHELGSAQSTINAYIHSISELESNLAKIQQEYLEAAHKLQMQMKETEQQRKELQEYRVKAQLALQMKDNLITELKANGSSTTTVAGSEGETDLRLLQMEFDALKQEHQQTLEECNTLRMQLDELRHDWQLVNEQHTTLAAAAHAAEDALRKELRTEREQLLAAESEQRVQAQELVKLRQQVSNQMAASATRLQEKDTQLQQLRAELMRRKMTVQNGEDGITSDSFNDRIKALTQTLVDKQQTVERITAERNALRIQLEKMQDQLQQQYTFESSLHGGRAVSRNALLSNTTDDVKAQFPLLMRENPFDNRVARRVKRVYSSLDSAGIRLGAFLRRYPLMRIFVLMYVGLLHLWVVFVLISSSPN
ncbi:golgin-84-like [Rhagoletis pomonella]|uniref:golgin-84 n=1 Tax=Rhagoletis pomonella TaxID=28610 RepID=UPI00177B4BC4|nr:golgin-84 [Rhagoletis pomonella]XP_036343908.1 golgin-84-like [Rhagoletis pomonella]